MHPQNEFQWCDPKSMLEKYQIDSEANVLIDPSKLKQMLPKLEKLEAERIERERKKKEQDREEAKKGEPDSMTKELLKEILTGHGVAFKKSSSKQELIAKVLELRRQLETRPTNGTCEAINGPSPRPDRSDEHTDEVTIIDQDVNDLRYSPPGFQKLSELPNLDKKTFSEHNFRTVPSFVYYYDAEQEKKLVILMHILFILDLFSCFLDMSLLNYVYNLLLYIYSMYQFFLVEALVHAILAAYSAFLEFLLILVCFASAKVNVASETFGYVQIGLL